MHLSQDADLYTYIYIYIYINSFIINHDKKLQTLYWSTDKHQDLFRVKKKQNIWHVLETWSYCSCGHKPTLCYGFWKETKQTMIMYGTDKNPDWEKKAQTHHHDNICGVKDQSTESTNHHLVSEVRWSLWDWPEEEIRLKENDQNRKGRRRIQYHTHTHSLRISGSV